jgi:hypothetical protein
MYFVVILVYFMVFWCILLSFGIFYGILWYFGIFCCHLVYLVVIWHILWPLGIYFPILVCCSKKNLATLTQRRNCPEISFVGFYYQEVFFNRSQIKYGPCNSKFNPFNFFKNTLIWWGVNMINLYYETIAYHVGTYIKVGKV